MISLLIRAISALHSDEEGQALVEYALIVLLVALAAITLLSAVGAFPSSVFSHINADFP
jgi:Flp pilus assembly pilin Flp